MQQNLTSIVLGLALMTSIALPASRALGQASQEQANTARVAAPSADSPLAKPVVSAAAELKAQRTTTWNENGTQWLLLEGDVSFSLGIYGFRGNRAVAQIETERRPGNPVRHIAVYLDDAKTLGGGPIGAEATRLLVTASTVGDIKLVTDLRVPRDAPPDHALVDAGRSRMHRVREKLATSVADMTAPPVIDPQSAARKQAAREAVEQQRSMVRLPEAPKPPSRMPKQPKPDEPVVQLPKQPGSSPSPQGTILPVRGALMFNADRVVFDNDEDEAALSLVGDVRVFYQDYANDRRVSLTAEKMVLLLDSGTDNIMRGGQLEAGSVRGVYLEDNAIITDGQFTVRAPRMFYDLQLNRAILLEAVLYTWDVTRNIPLYMRAQVMQQTAASTFQAEQAILTTSEFGEPHVAIGAGRLTVEQTEDSSGRTIQKFAATDNTLRIGGTPVFYVPFLAGETGDTPIRSIRGGYSSQNGPEIETTWDVFALFGKSKPEGVDLAARLDYLGDHGFAAGVNLEYNLDDFFGGFDAYGLPSDNGTDEIGGRQDVEQDGDGRGYAQFQHRHNLKRYGLELSLEAAYVSDPTFLEEYFEEEAYEAKTYETSFYLKKQENEWAATFLASYELNDFTPQLTTLQAPGYTVDKYPELGYYRTGTSLWEDRLTWFTENRVSYMKLRFGDDSPDERGFNDRQSMTVFGIPSTTSFDQAAEDLGLPRDERLRFDSRHEINAPLRMGIFDVVPYVTGRLTAYDEGFEEFSGEDDQVRLWGSVGTRIHTQFVREFNFDNRVLDVHRLRHILEPMVDVFYSASTIDSRDLPVYDYDVESLSEGAGVRLGLRNTLQTQRGGPGRWRTVDWIVLETDLVLRDDEANNDVEIARFFSYRPEFTTGGDHFYTELLWMVTDTFGLNGELTYNLENESNVAQWRLGATLRHTPRLRWFVNYEEIDILDSRLLSYGFDYELTRKYYLSFDHRLDFSENDTRDVRVALERKLPRWRFRVQADFDEIDDEATFSVVLVPEGFAQRERW